jgi:hypothetical protein
MAAKKQTCYPPRNREFHLPRLRRPMPKVDYYTARPLRQEEVGRTHDSRTIRIT